MFESPRPLAYSTLADLVHHVRNNLSLSDLSLAVNLFSKTVHDDSLPSTIQTMSCKLLLSLVDCIRTKSDQESGNVRSEETDTIVQRTEITNNHIAILLSFDLANWKFYFLKCLFF